MNIVLTICAVIAAVITAGIWWWRMKVGQELGLMRATETASARDIPGKAEGTLVELKGPVRASELIVGEFSGKEAVYVRSLTEREVETTGTDSDGKSKRERRYETVTDLKRNAPAELEDATGRVRLAFEGADVEAAEVHRRYEAEQGIGNLVGALLGSTGSIRGHRYTEWIIEAGVPVYVLGSVVGGAIGKDPAGKNPFVISIKSEEERERSLGTTRMWLLVAAVVTALLALMFLYFALTVGPTGAGNT